jgi:hypothetical protein
MRKTAGQTALALLRGPSTRRGQSKATGEVTRPGSADPLISNITAFSLQYAVAIIGHAVSGTSAGYFSGWAAALLRGYWNFDSSENAGRRAPN